MSDHTGSTSSRFVALDLALDCGSTVAHAATALVEYPSSDPETATTSEDPKNDPDDGSGAQA